MTLDIGYIVRYVQDYDVGIPKSFIVWCLICMYGLFITLFLVKEEKSLVIRSISLLFFCLYLFLVLYITVLSRQSSENYVYILNPILNYTLLNNRIIAEIILNILLFLPVGFWGCGVLLDLNILKVCIVGAGVSLIIELTQLFTKRGVCNTSDLIHNTIGVVIGYGLYELYCRAIRKYKKIMDN